MSSPGAEKFENRWRSPSLAAGAQQAVNVNQYEERQSYDVGFIGINDEAKMWRVDIPKFEARYKSHDTGKWDSLELKHKFFEMKARLNRLDSAIMKRNNKTLEQIESE